jgi:hypothetical protein
MELFAVYVGEIEREDWLPLRIGFWGCVAGRDQGGLCLQKEEKRRGLGSKKKVSCWFC